MTKNGWKKTGLLDCSTDYIHAKNVKRDKVGIACVLTLYVHCLNLFCCLS